MSRDGKGHRAYRRQRAALQRRVAREQLVCAWCGQPINPDLPANDPMAFTADHPIALRAGGALLGQELAPMHRRCNASKGDRAMATIRPATRRSRL